MLMLVNADFSESKFAFLRDNLTIGRYADLSQGWYHEIGPVVVGTQLFGAFMPIITFCVTWLVDLLLKCRDRQWTND